MQYLPSWFPGTKYATHAKKWKPSVRSLYDGPVDKIQREMVRETDAWFVVFADSFSFSQAEHIAPSCLITKVLEESPKMKEPHNIEDLKGVAATMYAAGVDTVSHSHLLFIANSHLPFWRHGQH